MSEDDVLPETSYTAEGKERVELWKRDLTDLAKDTGQAVRCSGMYISGIAHAPIG